MIPGILPKMPSKYIILVFSQCLVMVDLVVLQGLILINTQYGTCFWIQSIQSFLFISGNMLKTGDGWTNKWKKLDNEVGDSPKNVVFDYVWSMLFMLQSICWRITFQNVFSANPSWAWCGKPGEVTWSWSTNFSLCSIVQPCRVRRRYISCQVIYQSICYRLRKDEYIALRVYEGDTVGTKKR